jgi:hypothetical protein
MAAVHLRLISEIQVILFALFVVLSFNSLTVVVMSCFLMVAVRLLPNGRGREPLPDSRGAVIFAWNIFENKLL